MLNKSKYLTVALLIAIMSFCSISHTLAAPTTKKINHENGQVDVVEVRESTGDEYIVTTRDRSFRNKYKIGNEYTLEDGTIVTIEEITFEKSKVMGKEKSK